MCREERGTLADCADGQDPAVLSPLSLTVQLCLDTSNCVEIPSNCVEKSAGRWQTGAISSPPRLFEKCVARETHFSIAQMACCTGSGGQQRVPTPAASLSGSAL